MVSLQQHDIEALQENVFSYYRSHRRVLPWRETTDPYAILVSEFMLQQTQVGRVLSYYGKWLKRWSSPEALAKAELRDVLQAWQGLGYNRRGQNLYKTARVIMSEFRGDVLAAVEEYRRLPGVGEYTSSAVQVFSANRNIPAVDTNIRRILIAHFRLDENISRKDLASVAFRCIPKGRSREWHNALMDYGSQVMTAKKSGVKPLGKQGAFEGSDRQIRSRILRFLLSHPGGVSKAELLSHLKGIEHARIADITEKMLAEKLIICHNKSRFDIYNE